MVVARVQKKQAIKEALEEKSGSSVQRYSDDV
jgi:hypothetical protein